MERFAPWLFSPVNIRKLSFTLTSLLVTPALYIVHASGENPGWWCGCDEALGHIRWSGQGLADVGTVHLLS